MLFHLQHLQFIGIKSVLSSPLIEVPPFSPRGGFVRVLPLRSSELPLYEHFLTCVSIRNSAESPGGEVTSTPTAKASLVFESHPTAD